MRVQRARAMTVTARRLLLFLHKIKRFQSRFFEARQVRALSTSKRQSKPTTLQVQYTVANMLKNMETQHQMHERLPILPPPFIFGHSSPLKRSLPIEGPQPPFCGYAATKTRDAIDGEQL